ncbi:MAG: OmpH family outer membrane protein [Bacteroidales bacterium]|nr:OmpH family outer membrane protein [Candidatus Cacconaster merdequi]
MKRTLISLAIFFCCLASAGAQNMATINTETILNGIAEYLSAQKQLEVLQDQYKSAIEKEVSQIETLYNDYQSRKATYTASQRASAENEIIAREKSVQEKQKIYFGEDGLMARKTADLMDPIRVKVDKAVETAAKAGGYAIVFDLAVNQGVAFSSLPDISQTVINIYNTIKQ